MVVCHCNALREQEVREAARSGAQCPASAYASLGANPKCGHCLSFARELIAEEQQGAQA
jgi:bacterioferritin-associated ferredoxin